MTIAAILKSKGADIVSATPDSTLADVCATLCEHKIGAVLVCDPDGGIAGIMSERDVVGAVNREGAEALARPVSAFMTRKVVTCTLDDTINEVMSRMTAGRFRHLPVIEGGRIVGLISIGDVVKHRIAQVERDAEEMRSYISMA